MPRTTQRLVAPHLNEELLVARVRVSGYTSSSQRLSDFNQGGKRTECCQKRLASRRSGRCFGEHVEKEVWCTYITHGTCATAADLSVSTSLGVLATTPRHLGRYEGSKDVYTEMELSYHISGT